MYKSFYVEEDLMPYRGICHFVPSYTSQGPLETTVLPVLSYMEKVVLVVKSNPCIRSFGKDFRASVRDCTDDQWGNKTNRTTTCNISMILLEYLGRV